jgi:hypothetical protein
MTDHAGELDLFGNPIAKLTKSTRDTTKLINDMDLAESVLSLAINVGYRLIGTQEKVYRRVEGRDEEIESVPRYEADMVHNLIEQKYLTIGGHHHCRWRGFEGSGRSVLVPKTTKHYLSRLRAYKRPTTWGPPRHNHYGTYKTS